MLYDLDKRYLMPRALLELGTAAKMMWVYFNLTGAVKVSQRELGVERDLFLINQVKTGATKAVSKPSRQFSHP
jgi:hypothetical protein